MRNLLKFELYKIVCRKFFIISLILMILLNFWMLFVQYNQSYGVSILDSTVTRKGSTLIRWDKSVSQKFDGRPIDDKFLKNFEDYYILSVQVDKNENADAEKSVVGSSLFQLYLRFAVTTSDSSFIRPVSEVWGEDGIPVYHYTQNWAMIISMTAMTQYIYLIFIVLIFSNIFSGEYASGMAEIIYPSRRGRSELPGVKFLLAVLVMTAVYIFIMLLCFFLFGSVWGTENYHADIRTFSNGVFMQSGALSCLSLFLLTLLAGYAASLVILCVCFFLSAVSRTVVMSFALSAGAVFLPKILFLEKFDSKIIQKISMLMPINMIAFTTEGWRRYDYKIPLYILLLSVVLISAAVCYWASFFYIRTMSVNTLLTGNPFMNII